MKNVIKKVVTPIIIGIFFFAVQSAYANQGYVSEGKIVIDGIVYENRETDFSTIETSPVVNSSSIYDSSYDDPLYYLQPESLYYSYPDTYNEAVVPVDTDGKTVIPEILCYTPSHTNCKDVHGFSPATAVGEPVTGTFYVESPYWQKVIIGNETYYVPVDDIEYLDPPEEEEAAEDEIIPGDIEGNLTKNLRGENDLLTTCLWGIKNKSRNTDNYDRLIAWCEDHDISEEYLLQKRREEMNNNLNNKSPHPNDTLKTCLWGLDEKEEGWDEYKYVMEWCNEKGLSREDIVKKNNVINPNNNSDDSLLKSAKEFASDTVQWVDEEVIEPAKEVGEKAVEKTIKVTKHSIFFVKQPLVAIDIGVYKYELDNISSTAGRYALNSQLINRNLGLASKRNAFRHVLWQAMITKEFGEKIAFDAGNAHEINSKALQGDGLDKITFDDIEKADESVDLRNNIIGRQIALNNDSNNTNELAILTLSYFKEYGLWIATEQDDGTYIISKEKISEDAYKDALNRVLDLDEFGR